MQLLGFSMGSYPNHSFIGTLAGIIFSVFFYQIHLKFLWGDKKTPFFNTFIHLVYNQCQEEEQEGLQ